MPSFTTTLLRYWCRSESVDCFHTGLRVSTIFFSGMYCEIWYGPSEMVCCLNWALSGRYWLYSTGLADANGMARMFRKSAAGPLSLNRRVIEFGVLMPEIVWLFWNAASPAAVGVLLLNAAAYSLQ